MFLFSFILSNTCSLIMSLLKCFFDKFIYSLHKIIYKHFYLELSFATTSLKVKF